MGNIALPRTGEEELPARQGLFFNDQNFSPVSRRPQGAEESGRPATDHDQRILFHLDQDRLKGDKGVLMARRIK
jgi:hypothetical protein